MQGRRALSVLAIALLVVGILLIGWAVAPSVAGLDAPKTVVKETKTVEKGATFRNLAALTEQGKTYRLEVTSKDAFVVGERRSDRPDDAIAERGANGQTAGGETVFYYETTFVSTLSSTNSADPAVGPKLFFIKFPPTGAAGASTTARYDVLATMTPTYAEPLIVLKAWGSLAGLVIAGLGLALLLLRAALPVRREGAPPAEAPPKP